jgi:hypothetical protein
MSPVSLVTKTVHGIEDLAHERSASGDDRTDKDHFASKPLEIILAHSFAALNSSHLVQNVLNALGINADGHVHGVNDKAEDFHNLRREKGLGFRHRDAEVRTHSEPQLHLLQSLLVSVAATKEVINVSRKCSQQGSTSSHRHIENRSADQVDKVIWRQPVPKRQAGIDVEDTVDMKRKQRPITFPNWNDAERLVDITFPDIRAAG